MTTKRPERDVVEVIERIIAVVPASETGLVRQLWSLRETSIYSAPELRSRSWRLLSLLLSDAMPTTPAEPWQLQVGRIVRAEE